MIDEKIKNYVAELNEKAKEIDGDFASTYDYTQCKKYYKIWQTLSNQQRCIFAFIDEYGDHCACWLYCEGRIFTKRYNRVLRNSKKVKYKIL